MFWRAIKQRKQQVTGDVWLIVGLGNPGESYAQTRHNVGQMAIDVLAERIGGTFRSHRTNASICEGRLAPGGSKVVLAKPNSFMNLSGGPVSALARFFRVEPDRIIVLHDDLDLPFGSLKLKQGGGHGGHNGLRDTTKALSTPEFLRVRIGIGRPPGRQDPAAYVLARFSSAERQELPVLLEDAADATAAIITDGLTAAQQSFHGRPTA